MQRKGFRFVEVISPCPTLYGRRNRLGDGLAQYKFYRGSTVIDDNADLAEIDLDFKGRIVAGDFVDRTKPTFIEQMNARFRQVFGDAYKDWGGIK